MKKCPECGMTMDDDVQVNDHAAWWCPACGFWDLKRSREDRIVIAIFVAFALVTATFAILTALVAAR